MSENQQSSPENDKSKTTKSPRKRQVHNEVERRRKDKINGWIMKISELLPDKELHKASKISILEQTVSYIKGLVTERDKLLTEHCADIQEKEVNALKKKIIFLEEQNSLYAKLLQQAKISLTSLPKKVPKYSNKFTEERRAILLKKLNSSPQSLGQKLLPNNVVQVSNGCSSPALRPLSQSTMTVSADTSTSCTTINSNNVIQSTIVQNSDDQTKKQSAVLQDKKKISHVTQNPVLQNSNEVQCVVSPNHISLVTVACCQSTALSFSVSHLNELKTNSSVITVPSCTLETRTMLNAGGVTSALSPFPVMSSTLGSSFGNVYSRSIPTVIILPTGGGFVQPSLLSSNISVISPAVDNVLPILVPQPSHNVPTTSVNILGPSGLNPIVNGISNSPHTLLSLPITINKNSAERSLAQSSHCNSVEVTSSDVNMVGTMSSVVEPLPVKIPVSFQETVVGNSTTNIVSDNETVYTPSPCNQSVAEKKSSSPILENSGFALNNSSHSTNCSIDQKTNSEKRTEITDRSTENTKSANIQKSPAGNGSNQQVKKYPRNVPPSLQALSANRIISLANKLQVQTYQTSLTSNNKVSVENGSILCVDSISVKEKQDDIGNTENSPKIPSLNKSPPATAPSSAENLMKPVENDKICQNISQVYDKNNCSSKTVDIQGINLSPVGSFSLDECGANSFQMHPPKSNSTLSCFSDAQSDPKSMLSQVSTAEPSKSISFKSSDKNVTAANDTTNKTSDNLSPLVTKAHNIISNINTTNTSSIPQASLWSSNLLNIPSHSDQSSSKKQRDDLLQFDIADGTHQAIVDSNISVDTEPVSQAVKHSTNAGGSQIKSMENSTICQFPEVSKSSCVMTTEALLYQNNRPDIPVSNNHLCVHASQGSTVANNDDHRSKFVANSGINSMKVYVNSAVPSVCSSSVQFSETVVPNSHPYSNVTYINNIATPSNSKTMSHPTISWSNPTSVTCNTVNVVSTKEMEQNPFTFSSVQDYPNNVPINSLEPESTSSNYGLEKPKEKASGPKGRTKLVKKSKSLPGISSNTFNILPEVVSNIENFVTGTCDVFQSTQNVSSHQRISQHNNLMQKTDQLNSDILAKAAECILGHEAFHSMEISSEEPSSQRPITPYDATTSFSNSDVFNQIFTSSDTSKNPNCYAATKFNDDRFQSLESNKVKTLVPDKMHFGVHLSDNVATYENHSDIYTRVRKTNCNSEDEPQAKKAKENLSADAIISSSAPTPVYSTVSSNSRSQEHNKSVERADNKHPTMGTAAVNMPNKNNPECLPAQEATFYELTKKQSFSEAKNNLLSQNSLSNSKLSHLPSPVVSQSVCGPISHPVNNLFTDSVSSTCSKNNNVKTTVSQNIVDSNKNNPTSNYVGGNNTIGQNVSYSSSKELTILKSSNITTSESMLPHFLSHSNAMGFSAIQNTSHQTMSSANHFELFNTHASTITSVPQTKLQVNNLSHLPPQPSQPSLLLNSPSQSRDTAGRILTSLSSNLPANNNSAEIQSKTCLQSPVTTTSLSHSLCSLLKETPSNTLTSSVTGTPCSTSSPLDVNVSVSSGVSKYSALSLISNQSCLASKSIAVSKSNSNVLPSNTTSISCSASLPSSSVCNKNSKTSLSYSAERLIQNQCPQVEKDRGKTTSNIIPSKTLESGFYKSNNYIPMVNSEMNVQSLPRMPLPPATSFPTFPSSFPVCDVRPPVDMHAGTQYQDISQTTPKDMFSQASNFNLSSQAQRNPCTTQNISGASLPKSHTASMAINFDNSGTMYNSCNFLQHSMPNVDSGKSSDSTACFPPIFVNSNYSQPPPPKKNCCHFANQMPSQVGDPTTDKNFSVMPPIAPFPDKTIIHDSRPIQESSMTQNASSYVSNIFYEPTSCTHESIGGSKPSTQRASQETYVPHRTKQGITAQTPCIPSPLKTLSQNKGKTRKSKHNAASDLNRTAVFNPNNCMNFNVFTVPDLSCGKSNLHHVPNNYSKNAAQSVIPSISDMQTQQGKISESLLNSVMSPHHAPFNSTLHQQNDLLNLNFQPPNYSGTPLTMHPPLTLSTCSTTPKTSRSFPSVPNPVPNFNLSNILPDMGCSSSDISFSPIKFPPDCQPSSSGASSMLSASHQTCTSSLYTPHPSVVPNALPPLLNHAPHALNRTRAPLPASASIPTIPQSSHFTSSQAQPFQNIIHSLNFSRPDRQN